MFEAIREIHRISNEAIFELDSIGRPELTCPHCGHTGKDVISYYGKVGGSDNLQRITGCANIDECLARQFENGCSSL